MSAARDAADILTSATFDGLLRLYERGQLQVVFPQYPPQSPNIVNLLKR
jgi:hypothetical protein